MVPNSFSRVSRLPLTNHRYLLAKVSVFEKNQVRKEPRWDPTMSHTGATDIERHYSCAADYKVVKAQTFTARLASDLFNSPNYFLSMVVKGPSYKHAIF